MFIRHCDNCNRIYQAEKTGREAVICKYCAVDCENVIFKLSKVARKLGQHGQDIMDFDRQELANEVHFPLVLVSLILDEGHFKKMDLANKNTCDRCKKEIEDLSKALCETCSKIASDLNEEMQNRCV